MLWVVVFGIVFVMKESYALPIGAWSDTALAYDLSSDYMDMYYGPWSPDFLRSGRLMGAAGFRQTWPFDRYGPFFGGDIMDSFYPAAGSDLFPRPMDYMYYSGYPKTAELAKENYVRDYPFGGSEVGTRDSVSMRNGPWRSSISRSTPLYLPPYLSRSGFRGADRFYNPFFSDYDIPVSPFRRPFLPGMSAARSSSLRWGGDMTYLRR